MCCSLTFLLFLLSVTAHMFLWIYWCTHMYKCLLSSATVKFKLTLLHTHTHTHFHLYSGMYLNTNDKSFPTFPDPLLSVALLQRERVFEKLMQLLGNSFSSVMGDCSEIEALGSGASCGSSPWPLSSGTNCLHCQCLFLNVQATLRTPGAPMLCVFLLFLELSVKLAASYLTTAKLKMGFKSLVSRENTAHPHIPQAELCKYLTQLNVWFGLSCVRVNDLTMKV